MATKPLDKMSKPELVKALKAAHKRIAKLEGVVHMAELIAAENGPPKQTDWPSAEDQAPKQTDWPSAEDQAPEEPRNVFPWNDKPEEK